MIEAPSVRWPRRTDHPRVSLAAPDPARLAAVRDRGVDLRPIADGSPF